jgi:hypothetical protein
MNNLIIIDSVPQFPAHNSVKANSCGDMTNQTFIRQSVWKGV